MTLRLEGLRPAHINAGLVSDEEDEQIFEIVIRVVPQSGVFLFSSLIMQENGEHLFVGVVAIVRSDEDLSSFGEQKLIEVMERAEIEHVLYDTAAMIARQVSATLMLDLTIPTKPIESNIRLEFLDQSETEEY